MLKMPVKVILEEKYYCCTNVHHFLRFFLGRGHPLNQIKILSYLRTSTSPKNSKTGEVRAGVPITYNGIDRIDNNIGYIMDNSITCCETCNRMKRSHEYDFFLDHVKKICENMSKKVL